MANRRDYYLEQTLTEGELDQGFDGLEQAVWDLAKDQSFHGVISGLAVSESTPVAMTIDATLGTAYDEAGRRIRMPANEEDFDCSVDEDSVPTEVVGVGNERWLALFAEFDRVLSDPRIDGASQQVYFARDEGFKLVIRQGAEAAAGAAVRVALDPTLVLLADIKLAHGQVSISNGDIDTSRRQDFSLYTAAQVSASDAGRSVIQGASVQAQLDDADAEIDASIQRIDNHNTGAAERHTAAQIDNSAGSWAHLTGATVQVALDELDPLALAIYESLSSRHPKLLLSGGVPSDGGGLDLSVTAATFVADGAAYKKASAESITLSDNSISWVFYDDTGTLISRGTATHATGDIPIAKVTTSGGAVTEIIDTRIVDDRVDKRITIRVSTFDNGAHFARLSDAIAALTEYESFYVGLKFNIELSGEVREWTESKLPITFPSDGWQVRGLPGAKIRYGSGSDADLALFDLSGRSDILLEGFDVQCDSVTAPSAVAPNRVVFYGSNSDNITIRNVRALEADSATPMHSFVRFDENEECSGWLIEGCRVDNTGSACISVPSPNTGGESVLVRSRISRCIFGQHSGGGIGGGAGSASVYFEEGADVLVDDCTFDGLTHGVACGVIDAVKRIRIRDCRFTNNAGVVLYANAQQCHVRGCDIDSDATYGVQIFGDYNFVSDTHVQGASIDGIRSTGNYNIVTGNQTRNTGLTVSANDTAANNRDDL